jgi:hypothetical protein
VLQNLFCFLKYYKTILIVAKYYTNLCNNKEGKERLNKNMNNCIYFRKNLNYDMNFPAMNFVLWDKTRISFCLNFENVNIHKNPFSNANFEHTL